MYCIIKSKSCYLKCNMKYNIIYTKYKMVIFLYGYLKKKSCAKYLYNVSKVYTFIQAYIPI